MNNKFGGEGFAAVALGFGVNDMENLCTRLGPLMVPSVFLQHDLVVLCKLKNKNGRSITSPYREGPTGFLYRLHPCTSMTFHQ